MYAVDLWCGCGRWQEVQENSLAIITPRDRNLSSPRFRVSSVCFSPIRSSEKHALPPLFCFRTHIHHLMNLLTFAAYFRLPAQVQVSRSLNSQPRPMTRLAFYRLLGPSPALSL